VHIKLDIVGWALLLLTISLPILSKGHMGLLSSIALVAATGAYVLTQNRFELHEFSDYFSATIFAFVSLFLFRLYNYVIRRCFLNKHQSR
jgi:hypothetical protein